MKIAELFPDVMAENAEYEFKVALKSENPVKWAKSIVGFANGNGGTLFVGVSDDRDAFGIDLNETDKTKNSYLKSMIGIFSLMSRYVMKCVVSMRMRSGSF